MMQFSRASITALAALSLVGAAFGQGGPLQFSFEYTKLDGQYRTATSLFTADASNAAPQIASLGDVTRNATPGGQAIFNEGFVANPDLANFHLELNVSNILGTTATGIGTFTITDSDNDVITGDIAGDRLSSLGFLQFGNFVRFFGELTNVRYQGRDGAGVNTAEGTFDGTHGGSVNFADLIPVFTGSLVQLFIFTGGGNFTSGDWGYVAGNPNRPAVPVGLNAELIPTPGAFGLLGLGGLIAARRRRN